MIKKRIGLVAVLLAAVVSAAVPSTASATNRYVCADGTPAGCLGSPAYPTLAAANAAAAAAGTTDVINLKGGELQACGIVAPPNVTYKTTDVSALPGPGVRIYPDSNPYLATLQAPSGGAPCITIPVGGHGNRLTLLRFLENPGGFSDVIRVGQNDTTQQFRSEIPDDVIVDRVVIQPNVLIGQKRGISMNGTNVSVINSWIWVNSSGQDSQCANAVNTPGPLVFSNNTCWGGAEGGLFPGGDQAFVKTHAKVKASPTPTASVLTVECFTGEACDSERGVLVIGTGSTLTSIVFSSLNGGSGSSNDGTYVGRQILFTSGTQNTVRSGLITASTGGTKRLTIATLSGSAPVSGDTAWLLERVHSIADLRVGDPVSCVLPSGAAQQQFVASIAANAITFTAPFSEIPATGTDCRWGLNPNDGIIEKNYIAKDLAWRNPIVAAPQNVQAVASSTGGTLVTGRYCYTLIGNYLGYGPPALTYSAESQESCADVPSGTTTGKVTITWTPVTGPTKYKVWGRSSGGQTMFWEVTAPTTTYVDTGSAGTTGTRSSQRGTTWDSKKLQEFKAGRRWIVRQNVYSGNWQKNQTGFAISFKSSNAIVGSVYPNRYILTSDVLFESNVIMHTAGCYVVVGQEVESRAAGDMPGPLTNITFRNNLCFDSNNTYQTSGSNYATDFSNAINGFIFEGNTIAHAGGGLMVLSGTAPFTTTNIIRNNLMPANTNGIKGQGIAAGSDSLNAYGISTLYNAIAGVTNGTSNWPAVGTSHNSYPALASWQSAFVNYGGGQISDYALLEGSPFLTAASDGGQLGANITQLAAYAALAISGAPSGAPTINTAPELPAGTIGTPYSLQLDVTGGTGAKVCTVTAGSPPTGVPLSSGCLLAGTPSVATTSSFTVRATDTAALSVDRAFTLTVSPAAVSPVISTASLPMLTINVPFTQQIQATGGTGNYVFALASGLMPPGTFLSASGLLNGACSVSGNYTFAIQVASGAQTSVPQQYTVTCSTNGLGSTPFDPVGRAIVWNGQMIATYTSCDLTDADRVRVKDLCIDDSGSVRVVIATSPTVVTRSAGQPTRLTFQADNSETLSPAVGAFPTNFELRADLTQATECRVHVYVSDATTAGATLGIQNWDGAAWQFLDGVSGPATSVSSVGIHDSAWTALAPAAKLDAPLRVVVTNTDGSNNLIVGNISAECR